MEKISKRIVLYLVNNQTLPGENQAHYVYATQLLLEKWLSFFVLLVLGAVQDVFVETAIFLAGITLLRSHAGGYHAKSFGGCFLLSLFYYEALYLVLRLVPPSPVAIAVCYGIANLLLLWLAPVNHSKFNGTPQEMQAHKKLLHRNQLIIAAVFLALWLVPLPSTWLYYVAGANLVVAGNVVLALCTRQNKVK